MKASSLFIATMLVLSLAKPLFAQGDPISNYLSSAEEKATNVVNTAGAQGRGVAMEAGQALLNAIASFRSAYADSLQLTDSALRGQQAILFQQIRSTVDRLDAYTNGTTTNLQGIADTLAGAVSNIPFSKDIPRVTRVTPIFLAENTANSAEVVVKGIGLSNGSPYLESSGHSLRPNTATDAELRFSLPPHAAVTEKPLILATTLHLFERKTRFLFFSSYVPRIYPIRLALYPRRIGAVRITPKRRVATVETRTQTTPGYRCASPHGEGTNTVPVSVVPTPGWTIDPSSIAYHSSYSNNGSFTMNTTSPNGFTATLTCSGWGRVTGPFGVVLDAGSVGVEQGTFSYTESRPSATLQNGTVEERNLRWGDSLVFSDMPADTETVVLELYSFNGESLALEGAGSNRFLIVQFNPASRVATVTAKGIEQALRQ